MKPETHYTDRDFKTLFIHFHSDQGQLDPKVLLGEYYTIIPIVMTLWDLVRKMPKIGLHMPYSPVHYEYELTDVKYYPTKLHEHEVVDPNKDIQAVTVFYQRTSMITDRQSSGGGSFSSR